MDLRENYKTHPAELLKKRRFHSKALYDSTLSPSSLLFHSSNLHSSIPTHQSLHSQQTPLNFFIKRLQNEESTWKLINNEKEHLNCDAGDPKKGITLKNSFNRSIDEERNFTYNRVSDDDEDVNNGDRPGNDKKSLTNDNNEALEQSNIEKILKFKSEQFYTGYHLRKNNDEIIRDTVHDSYFYNLLKTSPNHAVISKEEMERGGSNIENFNRVINNEDNLDIDKMREDTEKVDVKRDNCEKVFGLNPNIAQNEDGKTEFNTFKNSCFNHMIEDKKLKNTSVTKNFTTNNSKPFTKFIKNLYKPSNTLYKNVPNVKNKFYSKSKLINEIKENSKENTNYIGGVIEEKGARFMSEAIMPGNCRENYYCSRTDDNTNEKNKDNKEIFDAIKIKLNNFDDFFENFGNKNEREINEEKDLSKELDRKFPMYIPNSSMNEANSADIFSSEHSIEAKTLNHIFRPRLDTSRSDQKTQENSLNSQKTNFQNDFHSENVTKNENFKNSVKKHIINKLNPFGVDSILGERPSLDQC